MTLATLIEPRALNEKQLAAALGMSVAWVRKDRRTDRLLPFYKLGDCVRYNWTRVEEALAAVEEGGLYLKPRTRNSTPKQQAQGATV